jgi:hypothetical protein
MLKKRAITSNVSNNAVIKKSKIILYGKTYDYRIVKTKDFRWGEQSYILYIRYGSKPFRVMAHQGSPISEGTLIYQVKNYFFTHIKK